MSEKIIVSGGGPYRLAPARGYFCAAPESVIVSVLKNVHPGVKIRINK